MQVSSSPEPLLSAKPTQKEICRLYGIDEHAFFWLHNVDLNALKNEIIMIVVRLVLLMNANIRLNLPKNQLVRHLLKVNKH